MEQQKRPSAPGLEWRGGKPRWRATKAAIAKGYTPKNRELPRDADPAALTNACERFSAEMKMWLSGRITKSEPDFDGTFRTLLGIYQTSPESSFHELAPSSRYPYNFYLPMLIEEIGARRIEDCNGKDAKRWFKAWGEFDEENGAYGKIAKAKMCIAVIKAALKFGIICKYKGCADFKAILRECDFPGTRRRMHAPTADQIIAARKAAHARGHAPLALAYAIQFEGTNRQTDVVGQWVPLSERVASAVIDGTEKWIGPTWKHVDQNLVLRFKPSKTSRTTGVEVVIDFKACPMVMEELQRIPVGERHGPLIVNPKTGLPYKYSIHRDRWRRVVKRKDGTQYAIGIAVDAGIPPEIWNRDLRAGGISEARRAAVPLADVAKVAGHAHERTTDGYDRTALETQQRLMKARVQQRKREKRDRFEQ
jgi:hypothetical protein